MAWVPSLGVGWLADGGVGAKKGKGPAVNLSCDSVEGGQMSSAHWVSN